MTTPTPTTTPSIPPARAGLRTILLGPTGKVISLCVLVVVLLVPTLAVSGLVWERERRAATVQREIGEQWGKAQIVTGPLLVVPATILRPVERRENDWDGSRSIRTPTRTLRDVIVIRPESVEAVVTADTELGRRTIYEARVYTARAALTARFEPPAREAIGTDITSLDWAGAWLAVGVGDLAAMDGAAFTVDGEALDADDIEPGLGLSRTEGEPGVRTPPLGLTVGADGAPAPFEANVTLAMRGSDAIGVAPAGLDTSATIAADWPHPSFTGARLPLSREIGPDGFEARWTVSRLSLPHAAAWPAGDGGITPLARDAVEVRLIEPVDHYDRVGRAVKHGTLVLIGVFAVAFLIEIFAPGALSVVQYLMVGAMIVVFYILLLALAEHVPFALAYALAAGASGTVLAAFVGSVAGGAGAGGRRWSTIAATAFAALYAMLYVVLGLEDLALLAGALFTFALLTTIMFTTRRIDWSGRTAG